MIPLSLYRSLFSGDASAEFVGTLEIISRVLMTIFLLLIFAFSSCKNEEIHFVEISEYFAESCHLDVAEQDSITRFAHKVAAFVALNPLAKEDPLYPRILHNIQTSSFTITWDTAWKDTIDISNR